jgi:4-hydroxythreonine-4-phosphate dehydrogenase
MPSSHDRPLIALAMGDPAGIGAELLAKLLVEADLADAADLLVIGDRRVVALGARQAGLEAGLGDLEGFTETGRALADLGHLDPADMTIGQSSREGGDFALVNFRVALRMAAAGIVDAVMFTPFNKPSMRLGDPTYVDEIGFIRRTIDADKDGSEFNILDEVWNARVTSHIPLSQVASRLTQARIEKSIDLTIESMQAAGFERPRLAVAGLNPHAGDSGNFGREDIDVIEPAVRAAATRQLAVEGPFSPDTVFLRVKAGLHDAVLTMYQDGRDRRLEHDRRTARADPREGAASDRRDERGVVRPSGSAARASMAGTGRDSGRFRDRREHRSAFADPCSAREAA